MKKVEGEMRSFPSRETGEDRERKCPAEMCRERWYRNIQRREAPLPRTARDGDVTMIIEIA